MHGMGKNGENLLIHVNTKLIQTEISVNKNKTVQMIIVFMYYIIIIMVRIGYTQKNVINMRFIFLCMDKTEDIIEQLMILRVTHYI